MVPSQVLHELICVASSVPVAGTNLRARLRRCLSISDVSERDGLSAESDVFLYNIRKRAGDKVTEDKSTCNEQFARYFSSGADCGSWLASCVGEVRCGPGCGVSSCSSDCYKI